MFDGDVLPPRLTGEDIVRMLKAALAHGNGVLSWEDVAAGLESGQYTLWTGEKSVCVTELHEYPSGKRVLFLFLADGDPEEFRATLPGIAARARGMGCCGIAYYGRASKASGWERMTPGFRTTHTCQFKEL